MKEIETPSSRLVYREEDFVYMTPCFEIIMYWGGPIFERADSILSFYRHSLEALDGSLRYFRTETMGQARPLKSDTLNLLPFWLQGTKSGRDIYMLFLESGSAPDEASDRAFALNATPARGYVQVCLPISRMSTSVGRWLALAKSVANDMSCDFGQAGFAVHWNYLSRNQTAVLRAMNSLAPRYPGLDMSYPLCTKYIVGKGIKCADWLTFLSIDYCERLGGVRALRELFDSEVVVHDVKDGIMIQAGPSPGIGDVNRQLTLPMYHEVGRVLAPIRYKEHPALFGPRGLADKEATDQWLSRFDS